MNAFASSIVYLDHIAPVWQALSERGTLYVRPALAGIAAARGLQATVGVPDRGPVLVASYTDLRTVRPARSVLLEHGVGNVYGDNHPSNPGGRDRDDCLLFLCTNDRVRDANLATYPHIPAVTIGAPKLDRYHGVTLVDSEVVAISFHWRNPQCPETNWALPHYQEMLPAVCEHFSVIGHGHPRFGRFFARLWASLGVEYVADLDEVIARSGVYVCDNSSSMYEYAAVRGPVVVLNAPWYRREVHHGLRFWDALPGLVCNQPHNLIATIAKALRDPSEARQSRANAVRAAYPALDGSASARAVQALRAEVAWQHPTPTSPI